jgi:hypothetical protein
MPRMIICECGCGKTIRANKSRRRPARFLPGHYLRTREAHVKAGEARRAKPPDDWVPPSGLCECGCGQKTELAPYSKAEKGQFKGYPMRYVQGHNLEHGSGPDHPQWKGGRFLGSDGYWFVLIPDHPRANARGYVREHILVWEETNGRPLESAEVVHHINGITTDNAPENLVALKRSVHVRLHKSPKHERRRQSMAIKAKFRDPKWKAKWAASMRKLTGKREYRAKLAAGNKRAWADHPDRRVKLAQRNKRRKMTPEYRARLSAAQKRAWKKSGQARHKRISEAMKRRWAKWRENQ